MRTSLSIFFALAMLALACKPSTEPTSSTAEYDAFGDVIQPEGAITYDALLAKLDQDSVYQGKVRGTVESVCQAKGCWINIVSPNRSEEMFVKFKDYGFFMPKDCAGKEVIMRGKAFKEETSVAELRHYAEDEGLSEEEIAAITEPVTELKFMADGVLLVKK